MSGSFHKSSHFTAFDSAAGEAAHHQDAEEGGSNLPFAPSPKIIPAAGQHTAPSERAPPKEEVVRSGDGLALPESALSRYRVCFYNETSDSTGHDHHVCQLEVEVTASGADQALEDAIAEFEKHEEVSSWRARAHTVECTRVG